jgi:hypothetical protein
MPFRTTDTRFAFTPARTSSDLISPETAMTAGNARMMCLSAG